MSIDEIKQEIEKIKQASGDFEAAHGLEDDLREWFIDYVSKLDVLSGEDIQEKAALILSTNEIDFPRYCS